MSRYIWIRGFVCVAEGNMCICSGLRARYRKIPYNFRVVDQQPVMDQLRHIYFFITRIYLLNFAERICFGKKEGGMR